MKRSPNISAREPAQPAPVTAVNADAKVGNLIADPAFRHEIEALHRLGPRVTGELIADLARRYGPEVRTCMSAFAHLDPEALAELDALLWPPLPVYLVREAGDLINSYGST
jgi:hypothetical protein